MPPKVMINKPIKINAQFGTIRINPAAVKRGGVALFEGQVEKNSPKPEKLAFHCIAVDLTRVRVSPMVNPLGHEYAWGDATVRGYIKGDWNAWVKDYFSQISSVFRAVTPQQYVDSFAQKRPKEKILMVSDANGNLYWNLGHWIYTNNTLYKHYRERMIGPQTALVFPHDSLPDICAINIENNHAQVEHAVFGQRLLKHGQLIDFLSVDEETGRPLTAEFVGDLSHLVKIPFIPAINRLLFESNIQLLDELVDVSRMSDLSQRVFEQDNCHYLAKTKQAGVFIREVLSGKKTPMHVDKKEPAVMKTLAASGYAAEDFEWESKNQILRMAFKRNAFGHSLIGLTQIRDLMFVTKVYTDATRKGLTLEQVVCLAQFISREMGIEISDALLMSNGGDLRVGLVDSGKVSLIKRSGDGEDLLFRGADDYGITSAFVYSQRE